MVVLNNCVKYRRENWYIGSIKLKSATTKYNNEPRFATRRYFSRAVEMFASVLIVSSRRRLIAVEVT